MWPFGMTRQEMERFLREHSDELIEIVMEHLPEEAEAWTADCWEAS